MSGNTTIQNAINSWVKKEKVNHKFIDTAKWPDNVPCNGIKD